MSTSLGWQKWYWRDWFSDPEVRAMSAVARCGWFEVLGWMWCNESSVLTVSDAMLTRMLTFTNDEYAVFLTEIEANPSIDYSRVDGMLTIKSRRRARDIDDDEKNSKARQGAVERQTRYRERKRVDACVDGCVDGHVTRVDATESESESDSDNTPLPPVPDNGAGVTTRADDDEQKRIDAIRGDYGSNAKARRTPKHGQRGPAPSVVERVERGIAKHRGKGKA